MDNSHKIARLQAQIVELREQQKVFDEMPPDKKFATRLHELVCKWNHTDGCLWVYEVHNGIDDWSGYAHQAWLGRAEHARKAFVGCTDDDILDIVRKVGEI